MQGLRGLANALVVALVSTGLIIGALSISLVEFAPEAGPTATNILLASPAPLTATATLIPSITPTIGLESPTPSITLTFTITNTPPASCQPPFGWQQIVILAGDTLDNIALRYRVSKDQLKSANCLLNESLVPGTILYVPPAVTSTPASCNQGAAGWTKSHVVKVSETLYGIASNHYTTVGLLKSVNCRVSDLIVPGEVLWVPNVATRTPLSTPLPGITITATPFPTEPLTETALPYTATVMPTNTPAPTPTYTPITPPN